MSLLGASSAEDAEGLLQRLPQMMQERLTALSPMTYLNDIHAPLIVVGHDRDDMVIPVDESRRLVSALAGRPGVRYTEFGMFQHADPTQRKLPLPRLILELSKFYRFVYPIYRQAASVS